MDKRLKTRWVKALRSGKFKQGQGRLKHKDPDGDDPKKMYFCCLGVLREIQPSIRGMKGDKTVYLSEKGSGLSCPIQYKLATFNDGRDMTKPWSFKKIATWIEKNL